MIDQPKSNSVGKEISNLLLNDLKGLLKKYKLDITECPIPAEVIGFFGRSIHNKSLTKKQVKALMVKWFEENLNKE